MTSPVSKRLFEKFLLRWVKILTAKDFDAAMRMADAVTSPATPPALPVAVTERTPSASESAFALPEVQVNPQCRWKTATRFMSSPRRSG